MNQQDMQLADTLEEYANKIGSGHGSLTIEGMEREPSMLTLVANRLRHLSGLVNNPQTEDFLTAVGAEAAHQIERWGAAHDRSKSAENWFWLVGYLAGKALRAAITGDFEKAKHHTISSAAALCNWHAAITRDESGAGQGKDVDLKPEASRQQLVNHIERIYQAFEGGNLVNVSDEIRKAADVVGLK